MKKSYPNLFAALFAGSLCSPAWAVDLARVISATPVMQQVAVPRQVCTEQQVLVPRQKSGAGAAVGAIAGGALGNAVGGDGAGRAVATVIGAMGGAVLGERIEGTPEPELRTVQSCTTQTIYESRPVAFDVIYEFGGKEHRVRMPHDPGPTLALQIGPVGAISKEQERSYAADIPVYSEATPAYAEAPPVYAASAPVVVTRQTYVPYTLHHGYSFYPAYPVYALRPNVHPPVHLEFGIGRWGGYPRSHHNRPSRHRP